MIKSKIQKTVITFFCVLFFVTVAGCGKAHLNTIKETTDISAYNEIHVLNTEIYSHEQQEKLQSLNQEFAQFSKEEIVRALTQKSKFSIVEELNSAPGLLVIESTVHIVYGSRALRYWVGFGAGKGSVVINLKLKDSISGEIKYELESKSDLSVGTFGGSMDKVIKNSITKVIKQFVEKL